MKAFNEIWKIITTVGALKFEISVSTLFYCSIVLAIFQHRGSAIFVFLGDGIKAVWEYGLMLIGEWMIMIPSLNATATVFKLSL